MRIAAVSNNKVSRIEVHADGVLVAASDNPAPSPAYSAAVSFIPTQAGNIKVSVTAIDASGQQSNPVELTLKVGSGVPGIQQSQADGNGNGSTVSGTPLACKPNAAYVADVTIPDNTTVNRGSSLVKTWRIRNTGECTWETGYVLAFQDGAQMGAPASVPVAPTARDAAVDVSVPFTAPVASGTYTSTWRMRDPDGHSFGNRVYMLIRVP